MKNIPSNAELVIQSLNDRRNQEKTLFNDNNPIFWKLSDLSIIYPDLFSIEKLVSQQTANNITKIITTALPKFQQLHDQPVHILNTKETYNLYSPDLHKFKTVKHGKNQYFTNIACEYLFGKTQNYKLEQAYFLYPDATPEELQTAAHTLQLEYIRDQIVKNCNLLSGIINRAYDAKRTDFRNIWSLFWKTMYHVDSIETLRERNNIKTSPLDYMKPNTLILVNNAIQGIILQFTNKQKYSIYNVRSITEQYALYARARFKQYKTTPEEHLTQTNSQKEIHKIKKDREKFWKLYYPLSLNQR